MKKFIAIIMVVFIALSLMAGCGGSDSSKKEEGSVNNNNDSVINTADVTFVANGESVYSIVRPAESKIDESAVSSFVFKQLKDKIGAAVRNTSDENDGTDAYEILIGHTNRPESQQALDYLKASGYGRYNDYVICTIGKKIVINAYNSESLSAAANYFIDNFAKAEGVKGGIKYLYAAKGDFVDLKINGVNIGDFVIIRPHFNSSYLTQVEMEKMVEDIYTKTGYMLEILDDDYTEVRKHEIVVGNTKRDGVKEVTDYDGYDISVSGNNVYLNGGSAHATAMAVSEFSKLLLSGNVNDASSLTGSFESAYAGYDAATTYYPVYYDNFDGNEIDTTKWRLMQGKEFGRAGQNGKYSGMSADPNYVYQQDGKFYIFGHEDTENYWGGTLTNDKTMAFQYGFVEHSVICPDGDGFWSLLWFSSTGDGTNLYYKAEIDLNECFGNAKATQANCHKWPTSLGSGMGLEHKSLDGKQYGEDKKYYHPDGGTWADEYHTFGFLWDETQMTFTADGEIWFSYDITQTEYDIDAFVNTYLYMKLSFSVGRENNNLLVENLTEHEWANTSVLICDWLYLYQLDNGRQTLKLK